MDGTAILGAVVLVHNEPGNVPVYEVPVPAFHLHLQTYYLGYLQCVCTKFQLTPDPFTARLRLTFSADLGCSCLIAALE